MPALIEAKSIVISYSAEIGGNFQVAVQGSCPIDATTTR